MYTKMHFKVVLDRFTVRLQPISYQFVEVMAADSQFDWLFLAHKYNCLTFIHCSLDYEKTKTWLPLNQPDELMQIRTNSVLQVIEGLLKIPFQE